MSTTEDERPERPAILSEDEIEARLAERPELLEQFAQGDVRVSPNFSRSEPAPG
jgi:hypothetical protein